MTCYLCEYEFCWGCGGSASAADRHFARGRGCGVAMLDEAVPAYDHNAVKEKRATWKTVLIVIGLVLAFIVLSPLILLVWIPFNCGLFLSLCFKKHCGCAGAVFGALLGVCLGIACYPLFPIAAGCFLVFWLIIGIVKLVRWCKGRDSQDDQLGGAEAENRRQA